MTDSVPSVSAVVPAFNEEASIGTCVERLLNQTVVPDEVIVVDNNSRDRTAEIARGRGARVVAEPTQGMIPARNRGFNEARCDVIARCDADTRVPPDWIERIRDHFLDPEVDALCLPYDTYGRFSCQNGPIVALNADRWRTAVDSWPATLDEYRAMLVNHEVGHLLGLAVPP